MLIRILQYYNNVVYGVYVILNVITKHIQYYIVYPLLIVYQYIVILYCNNVFV